MLRTANIPFTFLLVLCALYWATVIFGALNLEFLDLDLDGDTELGIDGHNHPDYDLGHSGHGFWMGILGFINAGKVPLMVVISFLSLSLWTLSLLYNYYLGWLGWWLPVAAVVPNLLASLVITKWATTPLVPLFKRFYEEQHDPEVIGLNGVMSIGWDENRFGVARVRVGNKVLDIKVRGYGEEALPTGTKVVIVERATEPEWLNLKVYRAQPLSQ